VGIGINVLTRALPDEVAAIATSIALERDARGAGESHGGEIDRAEVLADVLAQLDRDAGHVAHKGLGLIHARLTRHDALAGQIVESVGDDAGAAGGAGALRGVAAGIDLEGRLLVRRDDGVIVRVASGEMRVRAAAGRSGP